MIWSIPHMWNGGEVWILGGGPSVPKQFDIPDSVIADVVQGRSTPAAYSPYMSAIHNKHVIGINVAYTIGDWIDIVFFGDEGFYKNHKQGLAKFPGLRVSCHPLAEKTNWIKYTPRAFRHNHGLTKRGSEVCWNGNSGAAAINLAVHLGAKRIILLGFDMHLDPSAMMHWHDLYGRGKYTKPTPGRRGPRDHEGLPFEKHLRGFAQISEDAKHFGVEVINACPDSAITQFRKTTVKELLS